MMPTAEYMEANRILRRTKEVDPKPDFNKMYMPMDGMYNVDKMYSGKKDIENENDMIKYVDFKKLVDNMYSNLDYKVA